MTCRLAQLDPFVKVCHHITVVYCPHTLYFHNIEELIDDSLLEEDNETDEVCIHHNYGLHVSVYFHIK